MTIINATNRVRLTYRFDRKLDADQTELLDRTISWRSGSSIVRDDQGNATACRCHPDDLAAFRGELRERGVRIRVSVTGPLANEDEFRARIESVVRRARTMGGR